MWRCILVATLLAGCGSAPDVRPKTCDYDVLSVCVASHSGDYAPELVEREMRLALDYWQAPVETLEGWAIVYSPDEIPCPKALGSGCTWWDDDVKTIELQTLDAHCLETSQLVHELGHVIHHDGGHRGPWWSWKGEQDQTWRIVRSPGASDGCAATRYYTKEP